MSDQTIIVENTGTIFLAGPPLVKAATGEEVTANELGGAHVHSKTSGVSDHLASNDEHAISIIREIVEYLGAYATAPVITKTPMEPAFDPRELLGIMPHDLSQFVEVREIIARLVDESRWLEFKKNYSDTLVTVFAHLGGIPVGIIANNGVLFSESALKATHFIETCCRDRIPLLFIQNISGFMVGKKYEHEGIAKHGAKMVHAVANAKVPKITLVIGGSYGAGNYGMCGRAYDPDFLFMWPNAKISVMGGKQAANVLLTVKEQQLAQEGKELSRKEKDAIGNPILAKYEKESHAFYSSARLWDDGVINPVTTRRTLIQALSATLQREWQTTKFGIFRM